MNKFAGSILVVLGLAVACKREEENPLRDPARFAEIYAATRFALPGAHPLAPGETVATTNGKTIVDSVLVAQHFSREQLADAVSYFSEDPQRWQEVYQKVIHQLDSLSRRSDRHVPPQPPKK